VHTVADGDTLFALATGRHDKHPGMMVLATMAAEAVARATVRAVLAAQAITAVNAQGQTQYLPAARDL
jgi:L-aminopeptidase/D-esterase-like protein